jgi:hypothetical protein
MNRSAATLVSFVVLFGSALTVVSLSSSSASILTPADLSAVQGGQAAANGLCLTLNTCSTSNVCIPQISGNPAFSCNTCVPGAAGDICATGKPTDNCTQTPLSQCGTLMSGPTNAGGTGCPTGCPTAGGVCGSATYSSTSPRCSG